MLYASPRYALLPSRAPVAALSLDVLLMLEPSAARDARVARAVELSIKPQTDAELYAELDAAIRATFAAVNDPSFREATEIALPSWLCVGDATATLARLARGRATLLELPPRHGMCNSTELWKLAQRAREEAEQVELRERQRGTLTPMKIDFEILP